MVGGRGLPVESPMACAALYNELARVLRGIESYIDSIMEVTTQTETGKEVPVGAANEGYPAWPLDAMLFSLIRPSLILSSSYLIRLHFQPSEHHASFQEAL